MRHFIRSMLAVGGTMLATSLSLGDPPCDVPCAAPPQRIVVEVPPPQVIVQPTQAPIRRCGHLFGCRTSPSVMPIPTVTPFAVQSAPMMAAPSFAYAPAAPSFAFAPAAPSFAIAPAAPSFAVAPLAAPAASLSLAPTAAPFFAGPPVLSGAALSVAPSASIPLSIAPAAPTLSLSATPSASISLPFNLVPSAASPNGAAPHAATPQAHSETADRRLDKALSLISESIKDLGQIAEVHTKVLGEHKSEIATLKKRVDALDNRTKVYDRVLSTFPSADKNQPENVKQLLERTKKEFGVE